MQTHRIYRLSIVSCFVMTMAAIAFTSCHNNNTTPQQPDKRTVLADSIEYYAYKLVIATTISSDSLNDPDRHENRYSSPIVLQQHLTFYEGGQPVVSQYSPPIRLVKKYTISRDSLDALITPIYQFCLSGNKQYFIVQGTDFCNGAACDEFTGIYTLAGKAIYEGSSNYPDTQDLTTILTTHQIDINKHAACVDIDPHIYEGRAADKVAITQQVQQVSDFPLIRDTLQLMKAIKFQWGNDLRGFPKLAGGRFTAFEKMLIQGAKDSLFLLEYSWHDGSTGSYPWKFQFIASREGKLISQFSAERYALAQIFPGKQPYLLTTEVTGRGNGGHCFFRMQADTLEDVFDGFGDEYDFKTIDSYEDDAVLEPDELPATYLDVNGDGYNDIVFTGKKLMLGGFTKEGNWYDVLSVDEKTTTYSPENPASVIPIRFVFLYDPVSQHFKWKRPSKRQMQVYLGH